MRYYLVVILNLLFFTTVLSQEDDYVNTTILGNNAFALDSYQTYKSDSENIAISTFGVSTCMAMAYVGSKGKTQDEIADNLNFISPFGVLFSFKQLVKRYQIYKSDNVNLSIGNSLWVNSQNDLQKRYKNMLKVNFDSHVQSLNLKPNNERNAKTINRWIKKSSNFNIRSIIEGAEISRSDQLIYANYLYLNGAWENPFNQEFTKKDDFFLVDSTRIETDFMTQTSYLKYNENEIFQILELPYAGRNISMLIILPKTFKDIDSLERSLTPVNFDFWNGELYTKLVEVSLPKFRIEFSKDMASILKDGGCKEAFTDGANFSFLSEDDVYISKVLQKTVIEVEENKNIDYTQLIMPSTRKPGEVDNTLIRFNANKPFIFIVKDNLNNSILLVGKLIYPNFDNLSTAYYN